MSLVEFRKENEVGYIALNNPDKANALTNELKEELVHLLRIIRVDDSIRSLIITGIGKVFCSGGDIRTMGKDQTIVNGRERMKLSADWLKELTQLEKPTIAAVNGAAFGGGVSLALACDIIVSSEKSRFCLSFSNIALIPDMAALYFLPRRIGISKTKWLVYTAKVINANEAERLGLIDQVTSEEELSQTVKEMAEMFAKMPTYSLGLSKKIINHSFETNFSTFLEIEGAFQAVAFQTNDHKAAVEAFLAKKTVTFSGQ